MSEKDWFKVGKLECMEVEEPGTEIESYIIDSGEEFYLKVSFEGKPGDEDWENMKGGECKYKPTFFGHAIGPKSVTDLEFECDGGQLEEGTDSYTVQTKKKSVDQEGIWMCGVIITFTHANDHKYYGVLGSRADCIIQISEFEEFG